jgi:hypothetical protein
VREAETRGADHVTIFPQMLYDSPLEAMFLAFFGLAFFVRMPIWAVEAPQRRAYLGIGAFNLVRRRAFAGIEGFRHLQLSVDDDMRLGEALKTHGFRTRVLFGRGAVSLKWQKDAVGYIRGLEKNAYAALEFKSLNVAGCLAGLAFIGWVPYLAVALGPAPARLAGALAILATVGLLARGRKSSNVSAAYALTAPLAAVLLGVAIVLSMTKTKRRGGIVWRDTLYPLAELEAHVAERRAWCRAAWRQTQAKRRL